MRALLGFSSAAAVSAVVAGALLFGQHPATAQQQVAEEFVDHIRKERFEAAQSLLLSRHIVGKDYPDESFAGYAHRQLCPDLKVVEVFPPQSRGNRVRRWLDGRDVEMPEVQVQFQGQCHVRVVLRRETDGSWKVFNFGNHAT